MNLAGQYRRMIRKYGELVTIARPSGINDAVTWSDEIPVWARISNFAARETAGDVIMGDAQAVLMKEDLDAQAFVPKPGDRITRTDGSTATVISVDPNTRAVAGNIFAYGCQMRGV